MPASRTHRETLLAHCEALQAAKEASTYVPDPRDVYASDAPMADSIAMAKAESQRARADVLNLPEDLTRGEASLLVMHLIDVFGVADVVRWVRNVAATKGVELSRLDGGR